MASSDAAMCPITWASRVESPEGRTSPEEFVCAREDAKSNCPVSKALAAVPITLNVH